MAPNITFEAYGKQFLQKGGDINDLENILNERGASAYTTAEVIEDLKENGSTVEEVNDIFKKYSTEDVEVLLGDLNSVREKIILALKEEGFLNREGIYNWIKDNPLLLDVSQRTLSRELDKMVDEGLVIMEDLDFFWGEKEICRSVVIGSRPIPSGLLPGSIHLGIKIGNKHPIKGVGAWTEGVTKHEYVNFVVLAVPTIRSGFPGHGPAPDFFEDIGPDLC